ncbi:MAG: BON domain-containing protein [Pirellulaceae bacterium]
MAVPDKSILQKVNQKLSRLGGAQGKVLASIVRGDVTLSGTIQYEMQRASIMKVAASVPGVKRVIDQMKTKPKEHHR